MESISMEVLNKTKFMLIHKLHNDVFLITYMPFENKFTAVIFFFFFFTLKNV